MAKLNKSESAQVMSLMSHKGWEVLMKLVIMTIDELNARQATGSNAFEVLRSMYLRDGRVEGLKELFFNGLDNGTALSGERQ